MSDRWPDRHVYRDMGGQTNQNYTDTDRQTDRQTDKTGRQAGRQIGPLQLNLASPKAAGAPSTANVAPSTAISQQLIYGVHNLYTGQGAVQFLGPFIFYN